MQTGTTSRTPRERRERREEGKTDLQSAGQEATGQSHLFRHRPAFRSRLADSSAGVLRFHHDSTPNGTLSDNCCPVTTPLPRPYPSQLPTFHLLPLLPSNPSLDHPRSCENQQFLQSLFHQNRKPFDNNSREQSSSHPKLSLRRTTTSTYTTPPQRPPPPWNSYPPSSEASSSSSS